MPRVPLWLDFFSEPSEPELQAHANEDDVKQLWGRWQSADQLLLYADVKSELPL